MRIREAHRQAAWDLAWRFDVDLALIDEQRAGDVHWNKAATRTAETMGLPPDAYAALPFYRTDIAWPLAANPSCPPEILALLLEQADARSLEIFSYSYDWERRIRARLYHNPSLPAAALERRIAEPSTLGAEILGVNRPIVVAHLQHLLDTVPHFGTEHYMYAASNPGCPPELLRTIMRRGKATSYAACLNPQLTVEDVLDLIIERHPLPDVRYAATTRLFTYEWSHIRRGLLGVGPGSRVLMMARLDPERRALCANDEDHRLRLACAKCSDDADELGRLAEDPNTWVRRAASRRVLALLAA